MDIGASTSMILMCEFMLIGLAKPTKMTQSWFRTFFNEFNYFFCHILKFYILKGRLSKMWVYTDI